jgi:hypothetical protein
VSIAVVNKRYDDSREPHKALLPAVQAVLTTADTTKRTITFEDVAKAVPGLTQGVFHQIALDLGYEVVPADSPPVEVSVPSGVIEAPGVVALMGAVAEPKPTMLARLGNFFRV